jgi:hypothetical protein
MVTSNSPVPQALSSDSERGVAYNRWRAQPSTAVPVFSVAKQVLENNGHGKPLTCVNAIGVFANLSARCENLDKILDSC